MMSLNISRLKFVKEIKPIFFIGIQSTVFYIFLQGIKIWFPQNYDWLLFWITIPFLAVSFIIWKYFFIDKSQYRLLQIFQYFIFVWSIIQQFASEYELLEKFHPHSFNILNPVGDLKVDFLYFSIVTLATVGYGDITPVTKWAKYLVSLEILTGIIFLILIISNFHLFFRNNDSNDL